jgi:hypothetical protein
LAFLVGELHTIDYNIMSGQELALDARIARSTEKRDEVREALKDMKNINDNPSWFRDTPYYWAEASLPLAYALACVEVVSKSSEKARILYDRIVEAWSDAARCRHQSIS